MGTPRFLRRSCACISTSTPLGRIMRPTKAATGTSLRGCGWAGKASESTPAPPRMAKRAPGIDAARAQQRQIVGVLHQQVRGGLAQHRRHQAQRRGTVELQQAARAEAQQPEPRHVHDHVARRHQLEGEAAQHHRLHRHQVDDIGILGLQDARQRPCRLGLAHGMARGAAEIEVDDARAQRLDLGEAPGRAGHHHHRVRDLAQHGDEGLEVGEREPVLRDAQHDLAAELRERLRAELGVLGRRRLPVLARHAPPRVLTAPARNLERDRS